jgi:predicted transcriptional regulator
MTRRKISKDRKKITHVTLRLSETDKSRIERLADKERITASEWIRRAIERAAMVGDANDRVQRAAVMRGE